MDDKNYDIVMTYDNLMRVQTAGESLALLLAAAGLIFLVAGLIRPGRVRLKTRGWVVPITILFWLAAIAVYGGTIAFTHAQPNGPHAFESYMDGVAAMTCTKKPHHTSCAELKEKCAKRDPTHPACRILAGEDPRKFYSNSSSRPEK